MRKWIEAARLRTLPLSLSGILLASLFSIANHQFHGGIFLLASLTTVFLQVLSNYANDYGDGIKGTDAHRIGEKRAVASGEISAKKMKKVVILFSLLSLFSALSLLFLAFWPSNKTLFYSFIGLSLFAVWAAIQYTVGKKAYGYHGMGDIFVFIFFGWVAVLGTSMLYFKEIFYCFFLPASSIGLLSVAVLNLNNMRDIIQDAQAGKNTLVVKMGFQSAKIYHTLLMTLPFLMSTIFVAINEKSNWTNYMFLVLILPLWGLLKKVWSTHEPATLDSELKKTALFTLAFSLLLGLGFVFA